jgi:hypothetical protein
MNTDDPRLHEMTYTEIHALYMSVVAERDRWHDIARNLFYNREVGEEMYGQMVAENEEVHKKKTFAESVRESVDFVVNMMNNGNVNPRDVYPPGRYQGD